MSNTDCTLYNIPMSRVPITSGRSAGQRAGLSRESVLEAARRIADELGVDGLSMRRLAGELGVRPNALYTYFSRKEELLDALLDSLLGEIDTGDLVEGDWRARLVELMDASRRLLLAHPQLVPLFLSRQALGPNAARLGEITLQLLSEGGIEGERAVEALRVLLIFSLGFAAFQAPRQEEDAAVRTERGEATLRSLAADRFPEMRRLASRLARHPDDRNFYTGLGWLLQGIAGEEVQAASRRNATS